MKKEWKRVDEIYGYKTMKVPEALHKAIKGRAKITDMTIINYLAFLVELEAQFEKSVNKFISGVENDTATMG